MSSCVPVANAKEPNKKSKKEKLTQQKQKANGVRHGKDEAAIRKTIDSYVAAFNAGDAAALASHWSQDGVHLDRASGQQTAGRAEIQKHFAETFSGNAGARLDVIVESIRFVTDSVAVEEGVATLIDPDGPPSDNSTYTAIHVKQRGNWMIDSVRETVMPPSEPVPSNYENLRELEWMIGQWVDKSEDSTVETKCEWTKNRNFITRSFTASVQGEIELEGTQVIGWDPTSGSIRSWVFDSDGGFGEGTWERKGDRWIVKSSQVLPDGGKASSVNIFTYVDDNSFTWQSIGRADQRRVSTQRRRSHDCSEIDKLKE